MSRDKRKGRTIPKKYEKICNHCGQEFIGVSKAKFCSNSCLHKDEYKIKSLEYKWRLGKLLAAAKNRATTKELLFNLDLPYLINLWEVNDGCCEVTGQPFDLEPWGNKGQVSPQAPSIDRIIPKLGYVKGNVRIITYHLNVALSDFGINEFEKLITSYRSV